MRAPLSERPLVTTLMCTYRRPHFLRVAVEALQRQTYPHLEIIIVNNGNPPASDTVQYLRAVRSQDPRIIVIDYAENQYSLDDPQKMLDCLNLALHEVATGELVLMMDDDNFMADDYIEKMVRLFAENPACTTAAGLAVQVDADGRVGAGAVERARSANQRDRFSPGHLLVTDFYLSDLPTLWSASCYMFVIRRDEYIAAGGIQRGEHCASFYGVVPFGVTGFDPTAFFYNRAHAEQLHTAIVNAGNDAEHYALSALTNMKVEERWRERFGDDLATRLVTTIKRRAFTRMRAHAGQMESQGRVAAALAQYQRCLIVEPEAADIHRRIGSLHLLTGSTDEAIRSYEAAIKFGDDSSEVHARLAIAQYQWGAVAAATESLRRAIALDSGVASYRRKLAWAVLHQGQLGAALNAWKDAVFVGLEGVAYSGLFRRAGVRRAFHRSVVLARKAVARLGRMV